MGTPNTHVFTNTPHRGSHDVRSCACAAHLPERSRGRCTAPILSYLCAWCGDGFYQDDAEYYQITPPPKGSYEVLHHPLYGIRKDKRHEGPALIHIDCYRTYVRGGDAGGPRPFDKYVAEAELRA